MRGVLFGGVFVGGFVIGWVPWPWRGSCLSGGLGYGVLGLSPCSSWSQRFLLCGIEEG